MCVCMYIRMYACMYVLIYVCMHLYVRMYVCTVLLYVRTYLYVYTVRIHVNVHELRTVQVCAFMRTHSFHMCTYYIHMSILKEWNCPRCVLTFIRMYVTRSPRLVQGMSPFRMTTMPSLCTSPCQTWQKVRMYAHTYVLLYACCVCKEWAWVGVAIAKSVLATYVPLCACRKLTRPSSGTIPFTKSHQVSLLDA